MNNFTNIHNRRGRYNAGYIASDGSGNISSQFSFDPSAMHLWNELLAIYDQYRVKEIIVRYLPIQGNDEPGFFAVAQEFDISDTTVDFDSILNTKGYKLVESHKRLAMKLDLSHSDIKEWADMASGPIGTIAKVNQFGAKVTPSQSIYLVVVEFDLQFRGSQ
jgi:hypothetical protein